MRIGFLLSGSGSTFENLYYKMKELKTPAEIVVVLSSRSNAFGIERAKKHNIPYEIVEYKNYKNDLDLYSRKITNILTYYNVDLIVMGGFMSFYKIPDKYELKVINIHPALIPSFCGKSMYGDFIYKAIYDSGVKITGCTVHFVDNQYDHGPIIAQKSVEITIHDTPETIKEKVVCLERELYPIVIDKIVKKEYKIINNKVFLI